MTPEIGKFVLGPMGKILGATLFALIAAAVLTATQDVFAQLTTADSLYAEAQTALDQDDLNTAKKLLARALTITPDNCRYQYELGRIEGMRAQSASIFTKLSKARSCRNHFVRAVELCPDSITYLAALMEYCLQAPGIAGGDKKKADTLLARIFTLDSTEGYRLKASIAIRNKEFKQAELIYTRLLASGVDTVNTLRRIGDLLNMWERRYRDATPYYRRVLAASPENWGTVYQLGRIVVLENGDQREAIALFRTYLAHPEEPNRPSHAAARWRMGMAYAQLGIPDSAEASYQRALELDPGLKEAKLSLKDLRRQRR